MPSDSQASSESARSVTNDSAVSGSPPVLMMRPPNGLSSDSITAISRSLRDARDMIAELDERVILWLVADDALGVRDVPESGAVSADAVEYLKRNSVFVANVGRCDALGEELYFVANADPGAERPSHPGDVPRFDRVEVVVARRADPQL